MPPSSPDLSPDPDAAPNHRQRVLRAVWVALGGLCLLLGVIGIFLPVLPTTPFVLLAAACFARGSRRFHEWLLGHPRFGPLVSDWQRHRSIPFKAKCLALSMMWASMGTTAWLLRGRPLVSAALLACAVGVSVWMVRLPTRGEGGRES
ncbi:conserved hypothetical protein, DUF454; putative membrane component [Cupriavidus taiwanensis]|uniref:Inner membrane protein YbaN n=1 Tax=Cupriavidus taiwanensis TaxID=164546 RepID=A0A975X2U2_9BURK|nr:YbaN family protein [Cupriavidus taiwanensis]SOY53528.1 conserved hypothetical protein, DUF454; putative membrane component [Cupriavidus taiwanensis]